MSVFVEKTVRELALENPAATRVLALFGVYGMPRALPAGSGRKLLGRRYSFRDPHHTEPYRPSWLQIVRTLRLEVKQRTGGRHDDVVSARSAD